MKASTAIFATQVRAMEGIERSALILGNTWIVLTILFSMMLLAYVHKAYPARFGKLFRATFNERITRQVMREEMVFSHRATLILMLIAGIATSLNLELLRANLNESTPNIGYFFVIFLLLAAAYFARQGMRALLNILLSSKSGLTEFNFVSSLIYKVLGLVLIPIAVISSLVEKKLSLYFMGLFLVSMILAALFRWYRAWRIGRHAGGAVYHLLIYLCTLEILPLLVIIKGVIEDSSI
jgi:hypothetical protein